MQLLIACLQKVLHGMKNDYDIKIMKTRDEKIQIVWLKICLKIKYMITTCAQKKD